MDREWLPAETTAAHEREGKLRERAVKIGIAFNR